MYPFLRNRANVAPPLVINQAFSFDSDTASSFIDPTKDDASNNAGPPNDDDPFIPGSAHRGKKKRRMRDPMETMNTVLGVFQQKWEDDKEADAALREEEKEDRNKFLDIMAKNQKTMSDAVDVLRIIADKM